MALAPEHCSARFHGLPYASPMLKLACTHLGRLQCRLQILREPGMSMPRKCAATDGHTSAAKRTGYRPTFRQGGWLWNLSVLAAKQRISPQRNTSIATTRNGVGAKGHAS